MTPCRYDVVPLTEEVLLQEQQKAETMLQAVTEGSALSPALQQPLPGDTEQQKDLVAVTVVPNAQLLSKQSCSCNSETAVLTTVLSAPRIICPQAATAEVISCRAELTES